MLAIQLKKLTKTQKILKLKKKIEFDHSKYITTQEFNKFMAENFSAVLKKQI